MRAELRAPTRHLFLAGRSPAGSPHLEVYVPVPRRIAPLDHVRIGEGHMVHRQHPTISGQTLCRVVHPLTHGGLKGTSDAVTCPRCLSTGPGRAA